MGCMPSKPTKPKVMVLGASGFVGKATLSALISRHGSTVDIYAGVSDQSKFGLTGDVDEVIVKDADMYETESLVESLKGINSVFIVVPDHSDRTLLGLNCIDAAKEAGVKFILLLSILVAETDTIFGNQFKPLEDKVSEIGIPYAIIRQPIFLDDNMLHAQSIKERETFFDPRDPTSDFTPCVVADVGKAAADILVSYEEHRGRLYKLVSPSISLEYQAAAFTKSLGKEITVSTVHYNKWRKSYLSLGYPEWQVEGIIEIYKLIDEESPITNERDTEDIERITGEKPTTVEEWVKQNVAAFK